MGFDNHFMNKFCEHYLQPLSAVLYPECTGSTGLDSHRSFIVTYTTCRSGKTDVGLSTHYDNAEVTLNVSLGKVFTDGELYFGEMKGVSASYNGPNTLLFNVESHFIHVKASHQGEHIHSCNN